MRREEMDAVCYSPLSSRTEVSLNNVRTIEPTVNTIETIGFYCVFALIVFFYSRFYHFASLFQLLGPFVWLQICIRR